MIELNAHTDIVSIDPFDRNDLDGVVDLYNCSEGYRYATGISFPVTRDDIILKLDRLETSKNEFFQGIYRNDPESDARQMIGVISGVLYETTLWIKLIAILPQFRQKGFGSAAVALLSENCKTGYQVNNIFLSVIGKNEPGLRFWQKQGFAETGKFTKMLFGDSSPYEVIILHKDL